MNFYAIMAAIVAAFGGYVIGEHKTRSRKVGTPVGSTNTTRLPEFINGAPVGVPGYSRTKAANRPDQVYAASFAGPDSVTAGAHKYTPAWGPTENMPASNNESF
jgi:hypothetical protein